MKNHTKTFWFITFHTQWCLAKNHCVLDLLKETDLSDFILRYLVLICAEKYDAIYNRTRYLISQKSDVTYLFPHKNAKIEIDFCYSLPLEKTLTFQNVIKLIKSIFDKDKNHYYYNLLLENFHINNVNIIY